MGGCSHMTERVIGRRRFLVAAAGAAAAPVLFRGHALAQTLTPAAGSAGSQVVHLEGSILDSAVVQGDLYTLRGKPGSYLIRNEVRGTEQNLAVEANVRLRSMTRRDADLLVGGHQIEEIGSQRFEAEPSFMAALLAGAGDQSEVLRGMPEPPTEAVPFTFTYVDHNPSMWAVDARRGTLRPINVDSVAKVASGSVAGFAQPNLAIVERFLDPGIADSIYEVAVVQTRSGREIEVFPTSHSSVVRSLTRQGRSFVAVTGLGETSIYSPGNGRVLRIYGEHRVEGLRLDDGAQLTVIASETDQDGRRLAINEWFEKSPSTPRALPANATEVLVDIDDDVQAVIGLKED